MSSKQTTNYGLNQWAATDNFLREEFNRDNARIDGALANAVALNPMRTLLDVTTTAAVTQVNFFVAGITLSNYWEIALYASAVPTCYLRCNGNSISGAYYYTYLATGNSWAATYLGSITGNFSRLTLRCNSSYLMCLNDVITCTGSSCHMERYLYTTSPTYLTGSGISSLNIVSDSTIPVGSRFVLMGAKKG